MTTDTATKTIKFATIAALALGAPLEGGTFRGVITLPSGAHVAVVLLADKPAKDLPWADAKAWAESVDGVLPTRPIAALLYANAKGEFEKSWHWTADELQADTGNKRDESFAWFCDFFSGRQSIGRKDGYYAARAVRLIHLEV